MALLLLLAILPGSGCFLSCVKLSVDDPLPSLPFPEAEWITHISGTAKVCSLSIPGAHDSATSTLWTPVVDNFAKTQTLSIGELWDAGVRAFDLRPAVGGNGSLQIYHGPFSAHISFSECIGTILSCLGAHPGEFAVVLIRHEVEGDEGSPSWESLMREELSSLPGNRVRETFSPDLTVDDMRGRILFLSRNTYEGGPVGGYVTSWSSSSDLSAQKGCRIDSHPFWVQDYYDPEGEEGKWAAVKGMMDAFSSLGEESTVWCMNYTAGYVGGFLGLPSYEGNAVNVNLRAARYIRESVAGPLGIVMMDFAGALHFRGTPVWGDYLVKSIICHNAFQ